MMDDFSAIKKQIADMDDSEFGPSITEDMHGDRPVATPPLTPFAGVHPRLLLNKKTLAGVRRASAMKECREAYRQFIAFADTDTDGILPPAVLHETGRPGDYNMDCKVLGIIQAKAFAYQLTGDKKYGYQAVLAMKNYLRSLDIRWIHSDQCREFGFVMYMTACVYDWCYDLLTEKDKFQLTACVEHKLCTGRTADTVHSTFGGVKMEVGFPPRNGGAVSGHGSEMMILRDYLAYAVAIFDEHPGWYEYIGGRIYQDYVPVRNTFYAGGLVGQGTPCYASWRYNGDTWCSWIMKYAVGQIPFSDGQAQVARNMFACETEDGNAFLTGDIYGTKLNGNYAAFALQCAFLYGDSGLRAQAKRLFADFTRFGYGVAAITPVEFLILSSDCKPAAKDRHEGESTVVETSYPFGTMVARNRFDKNPAISYMKISERCMANHDHADHGSFQLYYKGLLTGDGGLYSGAGYGSDHHYYFHRATVAHNGLLVYNPNLASKEPIYNENGRVCNRDSLFYSGGQRTVSETGFLESWSAPDYDFAKVIGKAKGFYASGGTKYAYLAGDLTPAYPSETVDFVKRQMLTVFTENKNVPMLFFTFDCVKAKQADFKKTYVLQAPVEPKIEGNTVSIDNGRATLNMNILTDGLAVSVIGGSGKMFYVPELDKTLSLPNGADGREWGRVLVTPKKRRRNDVFLMAYTVCDNRAKNTPVPTRIEGKDCIGASVLGTVALFADGKDNLSFESKKDTADCYLCGLPEGHYEVKAGDNKIGIFAVTDENRFLTFRSTRGTITVIRV